jgi:hypothetical protein
MRMPRKKSKPVTAPTAANRKQLASTQAQFKKLESRLAALDKEYVAVQVATGQLVAGLLKGAAAKATAPKTTRTPKVQVAKKSAVAKAKPGRKPKVQVARKSAAPRQTVESVVVALLKANKKPMAFPVIMATIQKKKLIKTKSANFANVLRRTISTSSKIKRVGRGVYRV